MMIGNSQHAPSRDEKSSNCLTVSARFFLALLERARSLARQGLVYGQSLKQAQASNRFEGFSSVPCLLSLVRQLATRLKSQAQEALEQVKCGLRPLRCVN
jgi:hypothetical protein